MAGLKGATTEIGEDGLTVSVKAESAATARELAADLETRVRTAEGGWGAKANAKLANSLNRFDETLGIYGDRMLQILRDALLLCAMALAAFAWFRILPGYEPLMAAIGMLIVFAMKTAAGRLDKAEQEGDTGLRSLLVVIIIGGFILEVGASLSLQAASAVDRETGREDINSEIRALESERNMLQITLASVPSAPSTAIDQRIEALMLTAAVNSRGDQLPRKVGDVIGDCKGNSYYVRIYCPTLLELQAERDQAIAYELAQSRFAEIAPRISALQASRPSASSTFALAAKGGDSAWWLSLVIPMTLTIVLNATMLLLAYLAGRAKRTPALVLTTPAPAPTPDPGAVI